MNKKEMLNQLESEMGTLKNTTHMAQYSFAISILEQIDEPELPVIPQFVADEIERCKTEKTGLHDLIYCIENWVRDGWKVNDHIELIARAWLDGYAIEPPKTRQVLVKFFDNEEYKTELTEESARELIEFLEANKK